MDVGDAQVLMPLNHCLDAGAQRGDAQHRLQRQRARWGGGGGGHGPPASATGLVSAVPVAIIMCCKLTWTDAPRLAHLDWHGGGRTVLILGLSKLALVAHPIVRSGRRRSALLDARGDCLLEQRMMPDIAAQQQVGVVAARSQKSVARSMASVLISRPTSPTNACSHRPFTTSTLRTRRGAQKQPCLRTAANGSLPTQRKRAKIAKKPTTWNFK